MRTVALLILLTSLTAGGCTSTYDARFLFDPRPAELSLGVAPAGEQEVRAPVRALVTVIGVRTEKRDLEHPATVEVRLRLENVDAAAVTFDPASLALFSADLTAFRTPALAPSARASLAPGESVTVAAFFPFPAGTYPTGVDLSGLRVGWSVDIDGETVAASFTFRRRLRRYYDHPGGPYYHPYHYRRWYWCGVDGPEPERAPRNELRGRPSVPVPRVERRA